MKRLVLLSIVWIALHSLAQTECYDASQVDMNVQCTDIIIPVCGCDGITYLNECEAYYHAGLVSWTEGPCGEADPCMDLTGIDFGPCDLVLGWGYVDGIGVTISGCTYTGSNGFDYTDYIYATEQGCIDACSNFDGCIDPDLIDGTTCPAVYDPVCGCDGVTYSNLCEAIHIGGVGSWTYGECYPLPCLDMSGIDFGPCDAILGFG